MSTWYFIPARKGSKGFKHKNRKLLPITISKIPENQLKNVIVSTDDEVLIDFCKERNIRCRIRPNNISIDESSVREALLDSIYFFNLDKNDIIVTLLPTFPQRTFADIKAGLDFFNKFELSSCVGRKKVIDSFHPYLCIKEKDLIFGTQIVKHDFFRRQNYPECFVLCHFMCISRVSEINNLTGLLINENTGYIEYDSSIIDVDYKEDYIKYTQSVDTGMERFNPRSFEIDFDPFLRHFERYFQAIKLLGKTGKDELWLDCACGTGYGTLYLSNFATDIIGFDIDKDAVDYARVFNKNNFTTFTSNYTDIENKVFDVILSIETIEHMPIADATKFLDSFNNLLSKDGTLIITTPIVEKTNLSPTNEFHFFESSYNDFIELLAKSGFYIVDEFLKLTTFTDGETKNQGYFKCKKQK